MIRLLKFLYLGAPLAIAATPEPAANIQTGEIHVTSEGIVMSSMGSQEMSYRGHSKLCWKELEISVEGYLQLFMGISLKRGPTGGVASATELQSITANGKVTIEWTEGTRRHTLEGQRLAFRPAGKPGEEDRIIVIHDGGTKTILFRSPLHRFKIAQVTVR